MKTAGGRNSTGRAAWRARVGGVLAVLMASAPALGAPVYYDTSDTTGLQGGNTTWDTGTTIAWNPASDGTGARTTFNSGDDANFTVATASTVTIAAGGVAPGSTTISNTASTYTFKGGIITSGSIAKSNAGTANFGDPATVLSNGYNQSFTFNGGTSITGGTLAFIVTNTGLSTVNPQTFSFGSGTIALNGGTFAFKVNANTTGENKSFILDTPLSVTGTTGNTISTGRSTSTNNNPTGITLSGGISFAANSAVTLQQLEAGTTVGDTQITGPVTLAGATTITRTATGNIRGYAISGNITDAPTLVGSLSLANANNSTSQLFKITGTGNTYSGGTTILATGLAAVQVAANSSLGTGDVLVQNATTGTNVELILLGKTNIASTASLTVNTGAVVNLGFANTTANTPDASDMYLNSLVLGGTTYTRSDTDQTFNASSFPTFFTGSGEIVLLAATAAVPEPTSVALLGLGAVGLLARRRSHRAASRRRS